MRILLITTAWRANLRYTIPCNSLTSRKHSRNIVVLLVGYCLSIFKEARYYVGLQSLSLSCILHLGKIWQGTGALYMRATDSSVFSNQYSAARSICMMRIPNRMYGGSAFSTQTWASHCPLDVEYFISAGRSDWERNKDSVCTPSR